MGQTAELQQIRSLLDYQYLRLHFFFQAEDGIRDLTVTGVQTCALPIFEVSRAGQATLPAFHGEAEREPERDGIEPESETAVVEGECVASGRQTQVRPKEIGRASCRERV